MHLIKIVTDIIIDMGYFIIGITVVKIVVVMDVHHLASYSHLIRFLFLTLPLDFTFTITTSTIFYFVHLSLKKLLGQPMTDLHLP